MLKLFSKTNSRALAKVDESGKALQPARSPSHRIMRKLERPRLFVITLCLLVGSLLVWAHYAQIDRVVRVEGRIIPAGRGQEVQHLEGGIVASISTTEGSVVKRGDVLITIDNTAAGANLEETHSKLTAQRVRSIRLQAETQGASTVTFPPDLAGLPVVAGERDLFLSRKAKLDQELEVHRETVRQHKAELNEANLRQEKLASELELAHKRSDMMTEMASHDAASKLEIIEAQSREKRLETELSTAKNSIPALQAAISEEESRITTAQATFRSEAQNELVSVLAEIDQLKQVMTAESDRVKRTEVRSPIDGIVNRIAVNTVGEVVKPGETIVEIIPHTNQTNIEARALPKDRGYLRPGLKAMVMVTAYDVGELGMLPGRVTDISADTMQQDARSEPFYRVNILVDSIPSSYADRELVPGMMVSANIVTGRRTVLGYLLSPLRKFTYEAFRDSK